MNVKDLLIIYIDGTTRKFRDDEFDGVTLDGDKLYIKKDNGTIAIINFNAVKEIIGID